MRSIRSLKCVLPAVAVLSLAGCTALTRDVLVKDAGNAGAATPVVSHCSGSEWMDNSMMAIVPIPIIGLGMPTQEINEINADDVLARCGPPDRLVNRRVEVDRTACVPTVLTRLISFGVWQWCPADVSWDADVTAPPAATARLAPPVPANGATVSVTPPATVTVTPSVEARPETSVGVR